MKHYINFLQNLALDLQRRDLQSPCKSCLDLQRLFLAGTDLENLIFMLTYFLSFSLPSLLPSFFPFCCLPFLLSFSLHFPFFSYHLIFLISDPLQQSTLWLGSAGKTLYSILLIEPWNLFLSSLYDFVIPYLVVCRNALFG